MPVVVVLALFYWVLLFFGVTMRKGYGASLSTLRSFMESRNMSPNEVARLTGTIIVVVSLFFALFAIFYAASLGGLFFAFKVFLATIAAALIAYLVSLRIPPAA